VQVFSTHSGLVLIFAVAWFENGDGLGGISTWPKFAIVATIKTVPGKRDEYLKHPKSHGQRCRETEPGTLTFELLVPHEEADTIMLYEVYASPEAFQAHWTGPSLQQVKQDAAGLQLSLTGVRCDIAE
jgi:quinol monooxygenase YgiN